MPRFYGQHGSAVLLPNQPRVKYASSSTGTAVALASVSAKARRKTLNTYCYGSNFLSRKLNSSLAHAGKLRCIKNFYLKVIDPMECLDERDGDYCIGMISSRW